MYRFVNNYFGRTMNTKIIIYNKRYDISRERIVMPNRNLKNNNKNIGERIASLRAKAGYTQRDLAKETGISHRMIAYYEKQAQYPPTHVLPILADALGVTVDQMLGLDKIKSSEKNKDMRLWRRFSKIEKLDPKEKRQIMMLLDTFIEKDRLREKARTA